MTKFELADTLFAKANVRHTDKVYLWLGVRLPTHPQAAALPPQPANARAPLSFALVRAQANVMLEYTLDEAKALLQKNVETSRTNLTSLDEDLAFLRDQIVTTEVSTWPVFVEFFFAV